MEFYRRFAAIMQGLEQADDSNVDSDQGASVQAEEVVMDTSLAEYVTSLEPSQVVAMVKYLARFKLGSERRQQAAEAKRAARYGCTSSWYRTKNDPAQYAHKLEYNKIYKQRKREEKRLANEGAACTTQHH